MMWTRKQLTLLITVTAALAAPIPIAAATSGGANPADSFSTPALGFNGVAADSVTDAWAVGGNISGGALVAHWNGTAWTEVPVGKPIELDGVAAISPTDVWAVGNGLNSRTGVGTGQILHWNGSAWGRTGFPGPAGSLLGVAATSATNAWAVGYYPKGGQVLALHWDGRSWHATRTPRIAGALESVSATSARNVWAVGIVGNGGGTGVPPTNSALILHWNGSTWTRVAAHLPSGLSNLRGVTAISGTDAWAVGCGGCSAQGAGDPVTDHWNGRGWQLVSDAGLRSLAGLNAVASTSPTDVWAVGVPGNGGSGIAHWNGHGWRIVASPNPDGDYYPYGVAAASPSSAWAVGGDEAATPFEGVISGWNGFAWS
jgi:hypothetical protein